MSDIDNSSRTSRRDVLRKIALAGIAAYVAPSVLTISKAEAGNNTGGPPAQSTSGEHESCHGSHRKHRGSHHRRHGSHHKYVS